MSELGQESVQSDFGPSFFTILDNILTVGELARAEEQAARPQPHPGDLLEGAGRGCKK